MAAKHVLEALLLQLALAQHLPQRCNGLAYGLLTLLQAFKNAVNSIQLEPKQLLLPERGDLLLCSGCPCHFTAGHMACLPLAPCLPSTIKCPTR